MVDIATLKNVEVRQRGKRLLGPVNLSLSDAGLTVVIGPNGSGKTTFLRAMHGLERLSDGEMVIDVAPEDQAYVFQTPIMLRRSVTANLTYPPALARLGFSTQALQTEVDKWLEIIGLKGEGNRPALGLSGGEKQKLALARALISRPKLLFLDEPCANLDGRSTRDIEAILQGARSDGTRIILATHDMGQVRRLADDVVFIHKGKIFETGSLDQIMNTPQAAETQIFIRGDIVE